MGKKFKRLFGGDDLPDMSKDEQFQAMLDELTSGKLVSKEPVRDPDTEVLAAAHRTSVNLRTASVPDIPITPMSPEFHKKKKKKKKKNSGLLISSKSDDELLEEAIDDAIEKVGDEIDSVADDIIQGVDKDAEKIADRIIDALFGDGEDEEEDEEDTETSETDEQEPPQVKTPVIKIPIRDYAKEISDSKDNDEIPIVTYNVVSKRISFLNVNDTMTSNIRVYQFIPENIYIEDLQVFIDNLQAMFDQIIKIKSDVENAANTVQSQDEPQSGESYELDMHGLDEYSKFVRFCVISRITGNTSETIERMNDPELQRCVESQERYQMFVEANAKSIHCILPVNNKPIYERTIGSIIDPFSYLDKERMFIASVTTASGKFYPVIVPYMPEMNQFDTDAVSIYDEDANGSIWKGSFQVHSRVNLEKNLWSISLEGLDGFNADDIKFVEIIIPSKLDALDYDFSEEEEEESESVEEDGKEEREESSDNDFTVQVVLPD